MVGENTARGSFHCHALGSETDIECCRAQKTEGEVLRTVSCTHGTLRSTHEAARRAWFAPVGVLLLDRWWCRMVNNRAMSNDERSCNVE
eukprot:3112329-Rhodomonas_salina.1